MNSNVSDSTSTDMTLTSVGGGSLTGGEAGGEGLVGAFVGGRDRSSWALPSTVPSARRRGEESTNSASGVAGCCRVRERVHGGIDVVQNLPKK